MKVEVIDENDNIIEYRRVNLYAEKYNMIHIDELIIPAEGIKEIKLDGETIKLNQQRQNKKEGK